jgi:hypothetical protein
MAGRIGVKMPESVSTIRATIFLSSFFSFPEPFSSSAVCSHISVSGFGHVAADYDLILAAFADDAHDAVHFL